MPDLGPTPYGAISIQMTNTDIEVEGVIRLLADLQGHKAHRLDDIPARLLKETAVIIAPIFTLILNTSIHQCELLRNWKTSHVFPSFKKGSLPIIGPCH